MVPGPGGWGCSQATRVVGERKLYEKDRSRAHLGDGRGLRKWGRTQGKWTWRYSPLDPFHYGNAAGCGKGTRLQEMAVMVQCWVGTWCRIARTVLGDQRLGQGPDDCADKWCQAAGAWGAVLSYG